ncbi:MAG: NmrA family NAD(P)-binding protein [Gammaproteobacteria bacterium]|nr:NmrA family NAD(P)-binding protein [Gammaproteobacteria bacterium]
MILITGATGRIGRRVVERLVEADQPLRVLVRDEEKAKHLLPAGIDVFAGNLADYGLVQSAVDGTQSVMLLSPVDPKQVELQGNVVNAAMATSHPYIVKISGLDTAADSYVDCGRWHAETEQQIQSSGLRHTFLRPLFFMQNLAFLLDSARSKGIIRAGVGDSKIAMVDADDIAEVTTKLLMDKNMLMDQEVTLTTAESVTYHQVASVFTQVLARKVRYEQQSLEEVRQALLTSNQPEWHINILLQFNRAFLEGKGDAANTAVEDILGRPATTLLQYLQREVEQSGGDQSSNPFPS